MKRIIASTIVSVILILSASRLPAQEDISYTISWDRITDVNVSGVNIYRSPGDFNNPELIGTVSSGSAGFTDNSSLQAGIQYFYALKSRSSGGGLSGFSATVSGLTINSDCSGELKNLCHIDSVVPVDTSSCMVYWSTGYNTTGFVECWTTRGSGIDSSGVITTPGTHHSILLENLQRDRIYVTRAVSYGQEGESVVVSDIFPFITGSSSDNSIIVDNSELTVPEGESRNLGISLSQQPAGTVELEVYRVSGDTSLSVIAGSPVSLGVDNWDIYQYVTIYATEDDDNEDGQSMFVIRATEVTSIPSQLVEVSEDDNDPGSNDPPAVVTTTRVHVYPIPFNPDEGSLKLDNLPDRGKLDIYDIRGCRVWGTSWSGTDSQEWSGENRQNTSISSGRYFVVVRNLANSRVDKKAILVVR